MLLLQVAGERYVTTELMVLKMEVEIMLVSVLVLAAVVLCCSCCVTVPRELLLR